MSNTADVMATTSILEGNVTAWVIYVHWHMDIKLIINSDLTEILMH